VAGELQRDWARTDKLGQVTQILLDHAGATAASIAWEFQLLQANEVKSAQSFGAHAELGAQAGPRAPKLTFAFADPNNRNYLHQAASVFSLGRPRS
jgi:hypothetical protein